MLTMSTLIENHIWGPTTKLVLQACFEVHQVLGPGLLESVYEDALAIEFSKTGLTFVRQKAVAVLYKGQLAGEPFRLDFLVNDLVLLEIKAVDRVHPVHEAQILTYLKLTGAPVGFIINFHAPALRDGIRRYLGPKPSQE
jgi:GxxExxY protein